MTPDKSRLFTELSLGRMCQGIQARRRFESVTQLTQERYYLQNSPKTQFLHKMGVMMEISRDC